jgi:uncharacterized membrane protein
MNKRAWLIPILIVAVNVFAVAIRWNTLPEILPAHFDLQGNASGTMPRSTLLLYPLIGAAICLFAYIIARIKPTLQSVLIILSSGVSLVLFLSTMVSLTFGKTPVFMLAEPVVLLVALVGAGVCVVRAKKSY